MGAMHGACGCLALAQLPGGAAHDALEDDEPEGGQLHELHRRLQRDPDARPLSTAAAKVLHLQLLVGTVSNPLHCSC